MLTTVESYALNRDIKIRAILQFNKSGIMIKNGIIALLLTLCVSSFSYSQDLQHADKIIEVYGQEWYDRMQADAPNVPLLMDKYISHGFQIITASKGEFDNVQIDEVPLTSKVYKSVTIEQFVQELNSESFNPLRYQFFCTKESQFYKLKGLDLIIHILPQEQILLK